MFRALINGTFIHSSCPNLEITLFYDFLASNIRPLTLPNPLIHSTLKLSQIFLRQRYFQGKVRVFIQKASSSNFFSPFLKVTLRYVSFICKYLSPTKFPIKYFFYLFFKFMKMLSYMSMILVTFL